MRARSLTAIVALAGVLALSGVSASGMATWPGRGSEVAPTTHSEAVATTTPPPAAATTPATPARPAAKVVPAADRRKVATLSVTSSASTSSGVTLLVSSDARSVQVRYRTAANEKRSTTRKVGKGEVELTLAPGSRTIRVRARATKKLLASPWAKVTAAITPEPSPGDTYTVRPSSPILGKLAGYSTVNKNTRSYYLIRSYMQRFEARGGGTLVLAPGRYVISSTIYVPSNTTIRLSEGTTLVKGARTGTKKFTASDSMFMLIRPSLGKKKGAVGGHNGSSGITITGAGAGRSVIDMANIRNALSIISGHNRGVTISGITFRHMNNNHFIEMDACADCRISGNEFLDAARGTRETAEAINLDTPDPRTHGFGSVWSKQDGTPNERVTISSNRFAGMQRALGTHNFTRGAYHTDITVTGNTITSNADDAIHIMNWANPVFTSNTISAASGSVGIRACGTTDPTITGNTFAGSGAAVAFRTCHGENGTTAANRVTGDDAAALRSNLAGPGLGTDSVSVPAQGTVEFTGSEPPAGVPSQPLVESVAAGDRQVTVSWTPAWADARAPISAYRVIVHADPAEEPVQTFDAPADATEAVITGLANGVAHHVTVAAVNRAGESPTGTWAATEVTPTGPPSVPLDLVADSPLPGGIRLDWTAPENDGGMPLTGYRAHLYRDAEAAEPLPGSPVELDPDTISHEWLGLTEGYWYYLRVTALNDLGEGPASLLVPVAVKAAHPRMLVVP